MNKAQEEFSKLHEFAMRYARVSRSTLIEVEDAVQEMLVMAVTCKFKSREYVKRAMRNRYFELLRRAKMVQSHIAEMPEHDEPVVNEERAWEHRDMVRWMVNTLPKHYGIVLTHLLKGRTAQEIEQVEGISTRTVNRYILRARKELQAIV